MSNYIQDFGDYSVKNIKSFVGREGHGFNCSLYRENKKVGFCINDASGGEMHPIDWARNVNGREEQRLLREHIETLPSVTSEFNPEMLLEIDEGWFVEELVNRYEEQKIERKLQRQCQVKTLYRTSDQLSNQYWVLSRSFNEHVRQQLQTKHGEELVEIINDRF